MPAPIRVLRTPPRPAILPMIAPAPAPAAAPVPVGVSHEFRFIATSATSDVVTKDNFFMIVLGSNPRTEATLRPKLCAGFRSNQNFVDALIEQQGAWFHLSAVVDLARIRTFEKSATRTRLADLGGQSVGIIFTGRGGGVFGGFLFPGFHRAAP